MKKNSEGRRILLRLIEASGLSREEFAGKTGWCISSVHKVLAGDRGLGLPRAFACQRWWAERGEVLPAESWSMPAETVD